METEKLFEYKNHRFLNIAYSRILLCKKQHTHTQKSLGSIVSWINTFLDKDYYHEFTETRKIKTQAKHLNNKTEVKKNKNVALIMHKLNNRRTVS